MTKSQIGEVKKQQQIILVQLEAIDELHFQKDFDNKHQHGAEIQLPGEHRLIRDSISI